MSRVGSELGAARRILIEAAWSYRFPARISREQLLRQEGLAKPIRDTAWKAQERLCRRYRKLSRAGKSPTVVTTAIARELAGFAWAIAKHVQIVALDALRSMAGHHERRSSPTASPSQNCGRVRDPTPRALAAAFVDQALKASEGVAGLSAAMRGLIAARTAVMTAVAAIDADMRRMIRASATCCRLMTIPGVGQLTALAFVAAIDDPSRIRQSRDVGACLGVVPRQYQPT